MLREALADMTRAKSGILDFVAEPAGIEHLQEVPATLQRVGGALSILSLEGVEEVLRDIRDYVQSGILASGEVPPADQQDALAEAITAVELYLETLDSGSGDPRPMLETARSCVTRLNKPVILPADETLIVTPEHPVSPPGSDDDTTWMMPRPDHPVGTREPVEPVAEALETPEALQVPADEISIAPAPEPEPERYPVLSGEMDEEIKEIFLEEAQEEIERISEYLPRWRENPADQEALTTVRRSYHTLKGSGRLIGALLLGEFAWSMENLLNRIIDQSVSPGPGVYALLGEALSSWLRRVSRCWLDSLRKISNSAGSMR
jgi:chemosensory pili system protein ChpA (sensor histidine kinase/response regulator)